MALRVCCGSFRPLLDPASRLHYLPPVLVLACPWRCLVKAIDEPWAWESREYLRRKLVGKAVTFTVDYAVPSGREYGTITLDAGEPPSPHHFPLPTVTPHPIPPPPLFLPSHALPHTAGIRVAAHASLDTPRTGGWQLLCLQRCVPPLLGQHLFPYAAAVPALTRLMHDRHRPRRECHQLHHP